MRKFWGDYSPPPKAPVSVCGHPPGANSHVPRGENSGLTHVIPATDISMPEVRQTFETNVFGVMAMVQAFAPLLIAARGLIVNVASLAALTPYCKWKHRAFLIAPF